MNKINESCGVDPRGDLNIPALRDSVAEIIARHEALRADIEAECETLHLVSALDIDILPAIQKRNGVDLNSGRAEERKFPMRYFRKGFEEARMLRLTRSTSRNTRSRFPPRTLWMSSDE